MSLRIVALDIPPQDVITRDNVSVKVNAVLYMRVTDPARAIIEIEDYLYATSQLAQTTLRSVLGEVELDELLSDREKINAVLKKIIDERTEPWGIEVSAVEVKDVDLPDQMKRAMARQAEAERERRAKVIAAQGELQASETLAQAARTLATEPSAIQLRYLQTVTEIAAENNSTTIFPIPIELFTPVPAGPGSAPARRPRRCRAAGDEPPGAALPAGRPVRPDVPAPPRRGPDLRAGLAWARGTPARIDRAALERIIQRAAELQTSDRDIGEELTPEQVLALGREVGIPARYLQQALLEERTRARGGARPRARGSDRGAGAGDGPAGGARHRGRGRGGAGRMDGGEGAVLHPAAAAGPDHLGAARRGGQAALRRSTAAFSRGSAAIMLARADTVSATIMPLETGWCHVTLTAETAEARREFVGGGAALAGAGAVGAGLMVVLGALLPVALLPVPVGLGARLRGGAPVSAGARPDPTRPRARAGPAGAGPPAAERGGCRGARAGLLGILAEEIRRSLR